MTGTKLKVGRKTIELSNAEKVLFPATGSPRATWLGTTAAQPA
jgi:hypothetical protein